jgi:hypothetical protein
MVKYFADAPACALGDLAGALGGADAYILAGFGSPLADVAGGVERMKRDQVTGALPDTLGRRSSALGRSFADVTCALADIAARAGFMGLLPGGTR